jgi:hypothetical protein
MKDVMSEPSSVTGTISDIPVGWTIALGCLVSVVVSVTSGIGAPRERRVISVTGDEYTGIVVNSPGRSKLSADTAVCGERMVQICSGSEEVVLVVSFCRTLSSAYLISTSSDIEKLSHWLLTIKRCAINTKDRNREQRYLEHLHCALVKAGRQPKTPAGFATQAQESSDRKREYE